MAMDNEHVRVAYLVNKLVLPELAVKCAFLQRAEFESETWSQLLKTNLLCATEDVPVNQGIDLKA